MPIDPALRQQVEAAIMGRGDVTPRNMMGTTAYMVRNRMFAFWVADGLVAKLPDNERQDLLDRKAGVRFQGPQGRGFGEWTTLHLEKQDDLATALSAAKTAYDYVKGGAAAVAKRAKKGKSK
jgi:TfoX/Sxy family transcriptional regulator of competence genes